MRFGATALSLLMNSVLGINTEEDDQHRAFEKPLILEPYVEDSTKITS